MPSDREKLAREALAKEWDCPVENLGDRFPADLDCVVRAAIAFSDAERLAQSEASDGVRKAAEHLLKAVDTRNMRGRDHVPSMRDEQVARSRMALALAASTKVASDTCPFCTGASEYQGSPEDAFCERHLRLYRKANAA